MRDNAKPMAARLRDIARSLKRETRYYDALRRHPETPRASKLLLAAALGYALLPIDLIPDFIPVIGHLDDALIVPGLVLLAVRLVPDDLEDRIRRGVSVQTASGATQPRTSGSRV